MINTIYVSNAYTVASLIWTPLGIEVASYQGLKCMYVCVRSEDSVLIREVSFKSGSTEYFSVSQCDHLISGALDARESSDYADPVVQLSNEVTASHLHRRLQVHDLVRDVQLMADGLQCVCVCVCVCVIIVHRQICGLDRESKSSHL